MPAMPATKEGPSEGSAHYRGRRPVSTRLLRMENLLLEMRAEQDVKLEKINKLQQQFEELTETVKRRLI